MAKRLRARPSNTLILIVGSFMILILVALAGLNRPLPSYLIAASNLAPGSRLSATNVTVEQLDLGSIAENYATFQDLEGAALVIPVPEGELIPKRALGQALGKNQTSLRIVPKLKPASQITTGSIVSIWQVVETEEGYESQLLVPSALVSELEYGEGLFAGDLPEIELLIAGDQALVVMQAVTAEYAIYILPKS
jgi:hypothetical protein